ncbi:MAG: large subunit ribosomal protein L13 [Saprospiraceae bacterium]
MNTLSYKTQSLRKEDAVSDWYVVDATDQKVGRLCTTIATMLRGKHKASYTPHVDCGDNIIVINAEKVTFSGQKWKQKEYLRYSGYTGGLKSRTAEEMLAKKPEAIVEKSVRGMLPKTKLGRAMFRKLFVYTGSEHPHEAQKPKTLNV